MGEVTLTTGCSEKGMRMKRIGCFNFCRQPGCGAPTLSTKGFAARRRRTAAGSGSGLAREENHAKTGGGVGVGKPLQAAFIHRPGRRFLSPSLTQQAMQPQRGRLGKVVLKREMHAAEGGRRFMSRQQITSRTHFMVLRSTTPHIKKPTTVARKKYVSSPGTETSKPLQTRPPAARLAAAPIGALSSLCSPISPAYGSTQRTWRGASRPSRSPTPLSNPPVLNALAEIPQVWDSSNSRCERYACWARSG